MGGAGGTGKAKDKGTMGMIHKANISMVMATKLNRRALGMAGSSQKKTSPHHRVRGDYIM
jgi:hypothetical protein